MRNNILFFLLGIFVAISVAATTSDVMTVKPAKPVSVVMDWFTLTNSADAFIQKYEKLGYQIDFVEQISETRFIVVMEKY